MRLTKAQRRYLRSVNRCDRADAALDKAGNIARGEYNALVADGLVICGEPRDFLTEAGREALKGGNDE